MEDNEINPQQQLEPDKWDLLFAKYARIWIWSILFGAVTGVSFSYLGIRIDRVWGPLAILPLVLLVIGAVATLSAWLSLLFYLRISVLPLLFNVSAQHGLEDSKGARRSVSAVTQAYKSLLIAGFTRLLISVSELLFQLLGGF
ncbi:MAG: hypothetical protein Kow00121_46470 [Elainellaceae cyanobacterium]